MTNKYPANCKRCGGRVYVGNGETVRDPQTSKWITFHDECFSATQADERAAAALVRFPIDDDESNADAYAAFVRAAVKSAYAARTGSATVERGSYYDTTVYTFHIDPAFGLDANGIRDVLAAGDGQSMASYGSFGGYSTIGWVKATETPGTFTVESVYHIGD